MRDPHRSGWNDDTTKRHRRAIEGRDTNANRTRSCTDIYAEGIGFFTSAPLEQQEKRYRMLVTRYNDFLPEGDPVRAEGPAILAGLSAWSEAKSALDAATLERARAAAALERERKDWERTLSRLYHRLAVRFDKTVAERFFPGLPQSFLLDTGLRVRLESDP